MRIEKSNLNDTNSFSAIFLDYIHQKETLTTFYGQFPSVENFEDQMKARNFPAANRIVLADVLEKQYADVEKSDAVIKNISSLKEEKTFTITTGHQLNIFSGPLYFIYKIVTVINTCKQLKKAYPDYNFVPIYWMASEDHDFEEINHFHLFGKKHTWETDQKGAVGRFVPAKIKEILAVLPEKIALFEKAYLAHKNLADATRYFVNELFGAEGLVTVEADDANLKSLFREVVKDDLLKNSAKNLVEESSKELVNQGYKAQVNPRGINFFYLDNQLRERIILEGNEYHVNNTALKFSEAALLELLEKSPEKFSPNVIMRPLYQEVILPNLAYVGGPGEIAYWLQLKAMFVHYKIPFPILMPRNFAMVINKATAKKINKLQIGIRDLFLPLQEMKTKFLHDNAENELNLTAELKEIGQIFETIKSKAGAVDKGMEGFVGAASSKVFKSIKNIEKRLKKSEEVKQEVAIKSLEGIKAKLFPGGSPQERHDNFLNFYLNSPNFINELLDTFEPFDFSYNILMDD